MQDLSYLSSILVFLAASIMVVVLLCKFKLSPVLGYLVVGAFINHYQLIKETESTHQLAEFGIIFLLFMIGIELSFDRLIKMRLHVFGFGGLQVLFTAVTIAFIIHKIFHIESSTSIIMGIALALSSTAIVLQVLNDSGRQATQVGRLSLSTLLMQDFAVVPLLAVLPLLSQGIEENIMFAIGISALKALSVIIAITIFARIFLRPFFSLIASVKVEEVYVTTALLIVLGAAWTTNKLGLSTAMGAFIAGILIAETEYRTKIERIITPFQGIFMGLFFISIGMSIDASFIKDHFKDILLAALLLISVKALIIMFLCRLFKMQWGAAMHSALLLSQGGEFAFILFNLAAAQGVINQSLSEFGLMVVAISMAITPLLSMLGAHIENKIDSVEKLDSNDEFKGVSDLNNHVIVAGFGRVGRIVSYMLKRQQINYIAVESNLALVRRVKKHGHPVFHGEVSDNTTLRALGINRAKAVILTMSDKITLMKSTKNISQHFKHITIISRAGDYKESKEIRRIGAESAIPERVEVGLQLGGVALENINVVKHNILDIKEEIRKNNYSIIDENDLFST
jgi:CPA2 family monovalent cation:H+ antiporter-2